MPNITEHFKVANLVESTGAERLDVLGPVMLTSLTGEADDPCIMRGTIAPGGIVPLHSHADPEIFVQQSGTLEGLSQSVNGSRWLPIRPGSVFYVPAARGTAFVTLRASPRSQDGSLLRAYRRCDSWSRSTGADHVRAAATLAESVGRVRLLEWIT